jgi:arylsulfatase A-like enzyme/Flp pilus assembly protein TadD
MSPSLSSASLASVSAGFSTRKVVTLVACAGIAIGAWVVLTPNSVEPRAIPQGVADGHHVVLITLDTLRADRVGCYGCADVRTPHLDDLAANGVRYSEAVSVTPMTLPSHSSILTGQYPPTHGVRDNGKFKLDDRHTTLAEHLKAAGYKTAAFIAAFVLDHRYGLAQGFDHYADEMPDSRKASGLTGGQPQRPANVVVDEFESWFADNVPAQSTEPFFAWVHLFDPHTPYTPPPPYDAEYADQPYLGEIAFVDQQVGRLLGLLRERGVLDRTLIVVAGDHGEGLGDHGEDTHSRLIYESTVAVPMILHCPTVLGAPTVVDAAAVTVADITPTVLDLLGIAPEHTMDGQPLFAEPISQDRAVYVETLAPRLNHGWSPLFSARTRGAKYIAAPTPEYYDLDKDPGENNNLWIRSKPAAAVSLRDELAAMQTEFGDAARVPQDIVQPDAEAIRKLATLGYVASTVTPQSARDLDPKVMIHLYRKSRRASSMLGARRFGEAAALYREVLAENDDDAIAWSGLSVALRAQGQTEEAVKAIMRAIESQPQGRHWNFLARLALEKGDAVGFEAALQGAAGVDPKDGEIAILRGEQEFRTQAYDTAQAHFEEARRLDPSRSTTDSHVWVARVQRARGDQGASVISYRAALENDPRDDRALFELADILRGNKEYEAELPLRQTLCDTRPNVLRDANSLAQVYLNLGRPDDAIAALNRLVEFRPQDPAAYGNLGTGLVAAQRLDEAIEAFETAVALSAEYDFARIKLVAVLKQVGRTDRALEHCRVMLEQGSDRSSGLRRLLDVLCSADRIDEAVTELEAEASLRVIDWTAIAADPMLRKLTSDPRFEALRSRMQLPDSE